MPELRKRFYWVVACLRGGKLYCSSIVEGDTEEEALRNFYAESGVAGYAQPVRITRLGSSTSSVSAVIEKIGRGVPR